MPSHEGAVQSCVHLILQEIRHVIESNSANVFLGLNSDRLLSPLDSITFGYSTLSGTPGTGAAGYRIAGLNLEFITAVVPEPSTIALLGLAGAGLARGRRRHAA